MEEMMDVELCPECGAPDNYVDQLAKVRAVASVALQTLRHLEAARGISPESRERISDTIAALRAELLGTAGVQEDQRG
jgi:hypothetical protein